MRVGQKPPEIPVLSDALLKLADIAARELWLGINYSTGKSQQPVVKDQSIPVPFGTRPVTLSDERLIEMFSIPFYSAARAHGVKDKLPLLPQYIDPYFIRVAGLKAAPKQSMQALKDGIRLLLTDLSADYKRYIIGKSSETSVVKAAAYTSKLVAKFGASDNVNHRALAFRILFFAIPDFPCFNYSSAIINELRLSTADANFYSNFVETLNRGYRMNWERLVRFEMPLPTHLNSKVWLRARNYGWWQRRVFDLALVLHFNEQRGEPIGQYPRVRTLFNTQSVPYA